MNRGETKEKILDAAERLFAERGVDAVSVRAVCEAAGVNLALAHYHFGARLDLIRDVLRRRLEPLNAERLNRLRTLELAAERAAQVRIDLDELLRAFVGPVVEMKSTHPPFATLVGHIHVSPNPDLQAFFFEQFRELHARYIARLLPHLPPGLSAEKQLARMQFTAGAVVMLLTGDPFLTHIGGGGHARALAGEALTDEFVAFVSAGLLADATASR